MTGPIYALDIETDTDGEGFDGVPPGLDPRGSAVTSIAVYSPNGSVVFDDRDEQRMLAQFRDWLLHPRTTPGVVVTWNGACFDLPYLSDRAERLGIDLGFTLTATDSRPPKYEALPGHTGGYLATLGDHNHADIAFAYKEWALLNDVAWSLKPVATAHDMRPISVDREDMGALTVAERMAYNLSDVVITHDLAVLLGDDLDAYLDR